MADFIAMKTEVISRNTGGSWRTSSPFESVPLLSRIIKLVSLCCHAFKKDYVTETPSFIHKVMEFTANRLLC